MFQTLFPQKTSSGKRIQEPNSIHKKSVQPSVEYTTQKHLKVEEIISDLTIKTRETV